VLYRAPLPLIAGREVLVPGCDGLVVDVQALWAEIDAL